MSPNYNSTCPEKTLMFVKALLMPGLLTIMAFYLQAQPLKRLYIANDDHTDYMWTADEARYDTAFVKMLDYYLDQQDATMSNPPDFQSRFNCDGSYWIRAYQKYRSPGQFQRLISSIKSGHTSSPLNFLVNTYGAQPTEAVLRGMYYAGHLEREQGLRFTMAVAMENQTLPLGLSSLWAGSGAKYSWKGVCGCASRLSNQSLSNRAHQLYRYTGPDDRGVIMKWYNRAIFNGRTLGGYAECRREKSSAGVVADLGVVLKDLANLCTVPQPGSTYPFNIAGAFGYGWDDIDNFNAPAFITAARLHTRNDIKVRVSNEEDFFQDIERSYPSLPKESVSYGNEWDTYCASMNEITARVRRSSEKLRSAEALSSIVSLKEKQFARNLLPIRDQAWEAFGAYWEHDWTADGPVSQKARAEWQTRLQRQITRYSDTLFALSAAALGNQLGRSSNPRFYIFNPLGWQRNDVADILYEGDDRLQIVDMVSGKEIPFQLIRKDGKQMLRMQVENIPATGYKIFEMRKGLMPAHAPAATVSGAYISNKYYRLRLSASGAITEIFDSLAGGRQLVREAYGNYVNDLGSTNKNDGEPLVVENAGPVSVTLKAVSKNPLLHTVRVTLFANSPRIEIEDSIQCNYGNVQTWAFSFNLNRATTRHEELGTVLTARKESRGGDYANQNARYDWQTFNHFADMSDPSFGLTLSNTDCSFFRLGKSTPDSLWEQSSQLNALAGGQLDRYTETPKGWKDTLMMGIYNQDGQTGFKYQFALTSHQVAFDPVKAMKFSLEHQNPLVAGMVTGSQPATSLFSGSLLTISDPNILLWSLKPSEEGMENGLIARFWNMKGEAANPVISFTRPISRAWQTSHIETNERELKPLKETLTTHFAKYQLNTYRLVP